MAYKTNLKDKAQLRRQLASVMDDFTKFTWNGVDMWDMHGAFVVGGKDKLKFYNGAPFKNSYTTPQFSSVGSIFEGVSLDVWKIEFTMGVYAFDRADYVELLKLFDPYEVAMLSFGHNSSYGYICKVSSIPNSSRQIIQGGTNPLYYTEVNMTFEVVGEPVLYSTSLITINPTNGETMATVTSTSDLPFSFEIKYTVNLSTSKNQNIKFSVGNDTFVDITFNKIPSTTTITSSRTFIYNSEDGIIYDAISKELLTQSSLVEDGSRLISSYQVKRFKLSGTKTETITLNGGTWSTTNGDSITYRTRTNII